jgi:hypothetical protein
MTQNDIFNGEFVSIIHTKIKTVCNIAKNVKKICVVNTWLPFPTAAYSDLLHVVTE